MFSLRLNGCFAADRAYACNFCAVGKLRGGIRSVGLRHRNLQFGAGRNHSITSRLDVWQKLTDLIGSALKSRALCLVQEIPLSHTVLASKTN